MNYQDQVLALLGEANPVRDLDTIEDLVSPRFEAVEQRTGEMRETEVQDTDLKRPTAQRTTQRGLVYGVATAAGVLLIAAVTWMAFSSDRGADVAAAPVDIGRSFIDARNAWDSDAAVVLFAPGADIEDVVTEVESLDRNFAWHEAIGSHVVVGECDESSVGSATEVTCRYTYENAWTQALGVGPFPDSSFVFVVADGQIQRLTNYFDATGFSNQAWHVFKDWVAETHRDDLDVMYDTREDRFSDDPKTTPEALALWEQYTDEFVSSVMESTAP